MTKKQKKSSPVEPVQDRLKDCRHCDELSDMKYRLWGFHLAITGICEDICEPDASGLLQLSRDICERMDSVHAAFGAEHELRRAEKPS